MHRLRPPPASPLFTLIIGFPPSRQLQPLRNLYFTTRVMLFSHQLGVRNPSLSYIHLPILYTLLSKRKCYSLRVSSMRGWCADAVVVRVVALRAAAGRREVRRSTRTTNPAIDQHHARSITWMGSSTLPALLCDRASRRCAVALVPAERSTAAPPCFFGPHLLGTMDALFEEVLLRRISNLNGRRRTHGMQPLPRCSSSVRHRPYIQGPHRRPIASSTSPRPRRPLFAASGPLSCAPPAGGIALIITS
ncbi:hypothetical protein V8E36_003946 [Tilletia maclaganii]